MKLEEYLDEELKECCDVGDAVDLFLENGVKLYTVSGPQSHRVYLPLEDGVVLRSEHTDITTEGIARVYGVAHYKGLMLTGLVSQDTEYVSED